MTEFERELIEVLRSIQRAIESIENNVDTLKDLKKYE